MFPLHSKIVSEKIAHGTMTQAQITEEETKFFKLLDFNTDFVTPFDFYESYMAKLQFDFNTQCKVNGQGENFIAFGNHMM